MIKEFIFNGRDNSTDLILKSNRVAVSLVSVNRIDLVVDGSVLVSDVVAGSGVIIWDQSITEEVGKVMIKIGTLAANQRLAIGVYDFDLIVYDNDNPNGIVWRSSKNSNVMRVANVALTTTTTTTTTTL